MNSPVENIAELSWVQRFLHRISFLAIGSIIKFIVQFAIIVIYSNYLSLTQYGEYQFLWLFLNFFSILGLFGFTSMLLGTPVLHLAVWIKKNKKYIITGVVAINALAVSFLFIYSNYLSTEARILLVVLLILQNISTIAETILIKNEQEKRVFISNMAYVILYAAIHLYAIFSNYELSLIIYGVCTAIAVKTGILLYKFRLQNKTLARKVHIGREWLLLGINDMLGIMVKWIDKWLILFFLSAAEFAIYFNATYEIPIFLLLLSAVGNITLVEMSKETLQNLERVQSLFHNSAIILACIAFPSFWFLMLYAEEFILLIFGSKYADAITIFQVSILVIPVRIIYSTSILQVFNRTSIIVKGAVYDFIIAVIFMIIFYPLWGMEGLALAFVISTYLQVGYYLFHTGKLISKPMNFLLPVSKLSLLFVIFGALIWVIKLASFQLSDNLSVTLGAVICIVIIGSSCLLYYKKIHLSEIGG